MSIKPTFYNNLLIIRKKNLLTQEQIADILGVKRTTYLGWEKGLSDIPRKAVAKIMVHFGVTYDDLFSKDVSENITRVPETKLKIELGGGDNKPNKIPFYDTVAVGGFNMLAEQDPLYVNNAEMIEPGTWLKGASGALRVYGHSMFPKYPAGCIVAFKESDKDVILWGEDYVIELSDRRIVKRIEKSKEIGCISAVSYNKSEEYVYSPIDIPVLKIKRLYMVLGKVELEASI